MMSKKLSQWHQTKTGFLVFSLVELGLAYLFGSLAVNSGSLWQWMLVFVLLFGGLSNLIRAIVMHTK